MSRDFENTMINVSSKNLDYEKMRFKDIDAKAFGIITITGVMMTFLTKPEDIGIVAIILFVITSISFLISIVYSLLTIRVREVKTVSTNMIINGLKDATEIDQLRGTICTIAKAEDEMGNICDMKSTELRIAIHAFGFGIVGLVFYTISIILVI